MSKYISARASAPLSLLLSPSLSLSLLLSEFYFFFSLFTRSGYQPLRDGGICRVDDRRPGCLVDPENAVFSYAWWLPEPVHSRTLGPRYKQNLYYDTILSLVIYNWVCQPRFTASSRHRLILTRLDSSRNRQCIPRCVAMHIYRRPLP